MAAVVEYPGAPDDPHRAFREREPGFRTVGHIVLDGWRERALRAEQRVRDLEEAQGELLRLLGAAEWFEGHLRDRLDEAEAARDHLREAVELALRRIASGDFERREDR
jgi:hypothetical protein